MKNDTQREIGELIEEIISKGWGDLKIDVDDSSATDGRWVIVTADGMQTTGEIYFEASAPSLVEALGEIADDIRRHLDQPTRAQELEALLAADASHAAAPPVNIGPDASCGCGSRKPLVSQGRILARHSWATGGVFIDPNETGFKPGEIGTCPDCGRNYTFGPA